MSIIAMQHIIFISLWPTGITLECIGVVVNLLANRHSEWG